MQQPSLPPVKSSANPWRWNPVDEGFGGPTKEPLTWLALRFCWLRPVKRNLDACDSPGPDDLRMMRLIHTVLQVNSNPNFSQRWETEDRTPLSHSRAACMATTVSRCHRAILLRRWITSRGDFPYSV